MHEKITTVGGGNEAVWNTVKEEERSKTSCGPSCGVPELPPTEPGWGTGMLKKKKKLH
jgi:hypothetical protein